MSGQYFSPDSMLWKVDREMILLAGGGRALLMQLAHPKIAAGVAEHSHFQRDPLARLQRTMGAMWSIVFDEIEQAQEALQQVKNTHTKVHGKRDGGTGQAGGIAYDALDPDLLLWVHATLVDSALTTYERFVKALTNGDKCQYYEGTKKLAKLFEVPDEKVPDSLDAFRMYMSDMVEGGLLTVTPTARLLAQEILYPAPRLMRLGAPLFKFITAGLLPAELREAYQLKWNGQKESWLQRTAVMTRTLLPFIPSRLRIAPQARAAEKRLKLPRA